MPGLFHCDAVSLCEQECLVWLKYRKRLWILKSYIFLPIKNAYLLRQQFLGYTLLQIHLKWGACIFFIKRSIFCFYSKSASYIDFTLSLKFMLFYKVECPNSYERVFKMTRHNDVTEKAILRDFKELCCSDPFYVFFYSVSIERGHGQFLYFIGV